MEQNFQHLRKVSSQIFAKIIWSKFHKNRPEIVAFRDPYRHTRAQTGLVWTKILSHTEMTEYKKHLTRPFLLKGGGSFKACIMRKMSFYHCKNNFRKMPHFANIFTGCVCYLYPIRKKTDSEHNLVCEFENTPNRKKCQNEALC